MGLTNSVPTAVTEKREDEVHPQFLPLAALKQDMLEALNMNEEHYYAPFVNYRFKNSFRVSKETIFNIE